MSPLPAWLHSPPPTLALDIDARAGQLTLRFLLANQLIRIDECKCSLPSPVRSVAGR